LRVASRNRCGWLRHEPSSSTAASIMARSDEGCLGDGCGAQVPAIWDRGLYLRYTLAAVAARELADAPERHMRCNPVHAQFIVDDRFSPVSVEGPFDKRELDPEEVRHREAFVTRGWHRLRELSGSGRPIEQYPLEEVRARASRGGR